MKPNALSKTNIFSPLILLLVAAIALFIAYNFSSMGEKILIVVASYIILFVYSIKILLSRRSLTNATFVFIVFFIIYQIVNPILYVTSTSWVSGVEFFESNWDLLIRGNIYAIIGLFAYSVGLLVMRKIPTSIKSPKYDLLPLNRARRLVLIFYSIAVIAWLLLFFYAGMPFQTILGVSPEGRFRGLFNGIPGHMYVINLTFYANIAVLLYFLCQPQKSLISPKSIGLFYLVFVLNAFDASRLILIMAPVGAMIVQALIYNNKTNRFSLLSVAKPLKIILAVMLFSLLMVFYGQYRSSNKVDFLSKDTDKLFYITSTFDSSITYYMAIDKYPDVYDYWYGKSLLTPLLVRIPTVLFPTKYDYIWGSQKFTLQAYDYDQYDSHSVARGASMFGEAYINFGPIGVILIMFLFGCLNEYFSRRVLTAESTNLFKIIYIMYILYFIPYAFKAGVTAAITYIDIKLLLLLLPLLIMTMSKKKQLPTHRIFSISTNA